MNKTNVKNQKTTDDSSKTGFSPALKTLLALPLALIVLACAVCAAASLAAFIYSIVFAVAWESAMVFLIVLGASLFLAALVVASVIVFKKYLAFYRSKIYSDDPVNNKSKIETKAEASPEKSNLGTKSKYLTMPNIGMGVAAFATVLLLISAALGSLKNEKWLDARTPYMAENGYYAMPEQREIGFSIQSNILSETGSASDYEIKKINIDLKDKNAVVIYTAKNTETIKITYYCSFDEQVAFDVCDSLNIYDTASPKLSRPRDNMLFFMFAELRPVKQIRIEIPSYYRDKISISGDYIIAKN